jgi:hypothetical protein
MKQVVFTIVVLVLLGACAKYPAGARYEISRQQGFVGYFLKSYRFMLPQVAVTANSNYEWCFKKLYFNAERPQLMVVLTTDSGLNPSSSGVAGSVELKEGDGQFKKLISGPLADLPGGQGTVGQWCSQLYSNSPKGKRTRMAYNDCRSRYITISSGGSYCLRLNITSVDPATSGVKAFVLLESSWK